jgi:hypothetical protein
VNLTPPRIAGLLLCGIVMVALMAGGVAWIRSMSKPTPFIPDTASGGPRKNVKPVKPEPPPEVTVEMPEGIEAGDSVRLEVRVLDGKGAASSTFRVADGSAPNRVVGVIQLAHHFDVAPR